MVETSSVKHHLDYNTLSLPVISHLLKKSRAGRVEAARAAYRVALEEGAEDRHAVELFTGGSMLLERQVGDLASAHRLAERALEAGVRLGLTARQQERLRDRARRLASRRAASAGPEAAQGVGESE